MVAAVNHSGDSGSTGGLWGGILGGFVGAVVTSAHWVTRLEARERLVDLGQRPHAAFGQGERLSG